MIAIKWNRMASPMAEQKNVDVNAKEKHVDMVSVRELKFYLQFWSMVNLKLKTKLIIEPLKVLTRRRYFERK